MSLTALNAAKQYQSLRPATTPTPGAESATQTAVNAARDFAETLAMSEAESVRAMSGQGDPHKLVHALAQTELAVETAVAVRDKVVEAYQEILRMPV